MDFFIKELILFPQAKEKATVFSLVWMKVHMTCYGMGTYKYTFFFRFLKSVSLVWLFFVEHGQKHVFYWALLLFYYT
ncbi:hypothetical protein DC20_12640 [Rufibacter tibetensis]|uniref:Uncharacterized protein n=1 Tax=Rufibacter tibetensis TaxID=512763 RepID=A0A0N7HWM5_9BACT|nr:hypothetical protein DC20_12640 [Rufibacter tibetensis]